MRCYVRLFTLHAIGTNEQMHSFQSDIEEVSNLAKQIFQQT